MSKKTNFPNIVGAVITDSSVEPANILKNKLKTNVVYKGMVSAAGQWKLPVFDWKIEKLPDYRFKIIHNLNDAFYTLNVNLGGVVGNITIEEMGPDYFIINTGADRGFIFSMAKLS